MDPIDIFGYEVAPVSLLTNLVGAGLSISAARDARDASIENAELSLDEAQETIRRREKEQARTYGTATAYANASGIETGVENSTAEAFLAEMGSEFAKEIDWMNEWSRSRYEADIRNARNRYKAQKRDSIFGVVKSIFGG